MLKVLQSIERGLVGTLFSSNICKYIRVSLLFELGNFIYHIGYTKCKGEILLRVKELYYFIVEGLFVL